MMAWAKEIKENTLLRWNGVYKFQSKINLYIKAGSYILKTADTHEELIESCRLRHEVFYQEFQDIETTGIDIDKYDSHFDHLVIIHKETNKIIGTYRLSCTTFSNLSYTEQEFNLSEIYKLKGPHIELGRACIQKDHRKGSAVISLLWRGITEYMNLSGANILFGCSSIKINSPKDAALVYKYLIDQGSVVTSNFASPTKNFQIPDFDLWFSYFQNGLSETQIEEAEKLIPALLKSYLKFGAKIASEPAFDKAFDCVDVLTVLKKEEMTNSLARRFQVVQ
ncbi:MAG: GNAT family N-acetyltransferase [Bacteriovorax sp.]|nr:GNAT family N-acetyltransferase [Bacteriovorax sp.]